MTHVRRSALVLLATAMLASCATAGEGGDDDDDSDDDDDVVADARPQADAPEAPDIDASTSDIDAPPPPPPIDAADPPPDAPDVEPIDAGGGGLFCQNNNQCTVPGECCFYLIQPPGFCVPGEVQLGFCIPDD